MTIHLRGLPGSVERAAHSLLGLAPEGVCQATQIALCAGALLPHRFSLACGRLPDPSAVCSLLHYPLGRPNLALASILPCGVPTFLDPVDAEPRPPVQLPVSGESTTVDRRLRSDGSGEQPPSTEVGYRRYVEEFARRFSRTCIRRRRCSLLEFEEGLSSERPHHQHHRQREESVQLDRRLQEPRTRSGTPHRSFPLRLH